MNDDTKKSIVGPLMAKPNSEDRKLSSAAAATPTPTKKVIIKSADMLPDMQKEAVDIAVNAFEKHNIEKDVAEHIKKEFDKRHGPTWHCIVGRNFEEMMPGVDFHFESDVHPSRWRTLSQKLATEVRM